MAAVFRFEEGDLMKQTDLLRPMTRKSPGDEGRRRDEKAVECLDLSESDVSAGAGVGGSRTQKTTGEAR